MTDSDECCNIRMYLHFPFFMITTAIVSAAEERSISQIEDSLSEQVYYIYPAITPHKLSVVYSTTSWCILPPAHRLYKVYSNVCVIVIGLGMKVIIECIIHELPAITITTITTAMTTTTATIALDRDGCRSVMVVVGVLKGLGTGEAACWWYRDTVTTQANNAHYIYSNSLH